MVQSSTLLGMMAKGEGKVSLKAIVTALRNMAAYLMFKPKHNKEMFCADVFEDTL